MDTKLLELIADMDNNGGAQGVDTLSGAAFLSRGKLYREFERHTGHTVNEFMRRRRLSRALAYIKSSGLSLAAIAAECGYSSQQSMSREVKGFTGYTPLRYRECEVTHYFPPQITDCRYNISVSAFTRPGTHRLLYYSSSAKSIEDEAVQAFFEACPDYSGRLFGRNGHPDGGRSCYELYAHEGIGDVFGGAFVSSGDCPEKSALYASLTVKNDKDTINAAWDYLYGRWLSGSMYEFDGGDYFEEYLHRDGRPSKLKLYLPVKKRRGYTSISIQSLPDMRFCVCAQTGHSAERRASERVMGWLSESYPYLLKTCSEYYIKSAPEGYICGVRIKNPLILPENGDIYEIKAEGGLYALLRGGFDCDYSHFENILIKWLEDSGFSHDTPFTLYDTASGHDNPNLIIYCRIKNDTIR